MIASDRDSYREKKKTISLIFINAKKIIKSQHLGSKKKIEIQKKNILPRVGFEPTPSLEDQISYRFHGLAHTTGNLKSDVLDHSTILARPWFIMFRF